MIVMVGERGLVELVLRPGEVRRSLRAVLTLYSSMSMRKEDNLIIAL